MACDDGPPYYWHGCVETNKQFYFVTKLAGGGPYWVPYFYLRILPTGNMTNADFKIPTLSGNVAFTFTNDSSIIVEVYSPRQGHFSSQEIGFRHDGKDAILAYFQSILDYSSSTEQIKPLPINSIKYWLKGYVVERNIDTVAIDAQGELLEGNWTGHWKGK